MAKSSVILLDNASATGGQAIWDGGDAVFALAGSLDGETATLQFLGPDGSTWIDVGTETTLTAAGAAVATIPSGPVRVTVSTGGGSPSGLYASLVSVR